MRKKFVSLAFLVFILVCGYFSNAFSAGDAYLETDDHQQVLDKNNIGSSAANNALTIDEVNKNLLIGKISEAMHYKAGQLVAIQDRDGSISLYDESGYRATIAETYEGSKVWKTTNLQLRYTDIDWNKIQGKQERKDYLAEYLTSLGFNEGRAKALGDNAGDEIISFFENNKLNSSFTIAPNGTQVLEYTFNIDGKPQVTFDATGEIIQKWSYNDKGALDTYAKYHRPTLEEITSGITPSSGTASGTTTGHWSASVTNFDQNGRDIATYKVNLIDGSSNTITSPNFPESYSLDYANKVQTASYEYDKNGQKISETDLENNNITYFGYGRPLEVVHVSTITGTKTVTAKYTYYSGGTLRSVTKYNDNGLQTEVFIYTERSKGNALISGTTQDVEELFRQVGHVYDLIKSLNSDDQVAELLTYLYNHSITSINLYPNDLTNPYVFKTFFLDEKQQKEVEEKMKEMGPDATPQAAVEALMNDNAEGTEAYKAYKSVKAMFDTISKQKTPLAVNIQSGQNTTEIEEDTSIRYNKRIEGYDEQSGQGQRREDNVTYGYFTEYLNKSLQFSFEYIDENDIHLKFKNDRIVSSEKTGTITEKEVDRITYHYAPAVVGQAQAFVDADGNILNEEDAAREMIANGHQIYIQLNPQSINMFDGAGFKDIVNPKDGEQIFVAVEDMAMFDAFKGSVGTGAQVMVVGVVTNDIDGKMTMQVYNTTNGAGVGFGLDSTGNKGYAIGSQVGGMVDEINRLSKEEGSWVYENTKTNQGIFQAAGATDSSGYLKDWKDGWAALARLAGGR